MPAQLDASSFLDHFRPGAEIYTPGCAGHSLLFESWLRQAPERCDGVRFTGVHIPTVNKFDFASLHPGARQRTIFLSAELRESWLAGRVDYLPMSYSATWQWLGQKARFDVALVQVAPPDDNGQCSLGVAADFTPAAWPRATKVLAHVNPRMPRTHGPSIPWSRIHAAIEHDSPLLEAPDPAPDPAMDAVAEQVATLVPDRATLQLGLGRLQSAVLRAVRGRRDLRLHTGMVSDGLLGLIEDGALAPAPDAVVAGVALGSPALYEAVAGRVQFREVGYTHDHGVLRAIPRLTAINSALSVDLLGQVNGDCLGGRQLSGIGGLPDFLRGARQAPEGRGIIALPAATPKGQTRIVPMLPAGPVSVARIDADCVVTEHGVADLRHLDVHERARALIAIADPAHRESLERDWHEITQRL
ncbi:acetyl-CoA hydrolase/transferase C-terminal domain-containing protein [Lysobacter sp. A03]|uniref:acetyl-CoA hydrolase/transferase family protein n=1 Tax=Lysobacter sp. A03 TaxID=1199154 RepID=UPI0005B6A3C5|nr:acetyl-CoA hydrolase/transferase C-terminal domain-containing protein [Lysobacter sp. A03]KIQ96157.1 4-hydroxybutyrate coenzyme A transferase [Lysobacter sp. A03]